MMRIFVALPVSRALQTLAGEFQARYSNLPARWLVGKNLHLTLVPPWQTPDANIYIQKLRTLSQSLGEFKVNFDSIAFGPNAKQPRLIWAKGAANPALSKLKAKLEQSLNFGPPTRPFAPHLTLARFQSREFANFPTRALNEKINWTEIVKSFALYESRLLPAGADYEILAEVAL